MINARFMSNNYGAADFSTVTASSELANFAVSSAFDGFRFTGYRPTGAFEITSANKFIYINDGTDKSIELTEGVYSTPQLMAAHIQTRLNASSSNWTCTYSNSNLKFTIGRSSGTADLRFAVTTQAAWDTLGYLGSSTTAAGTGLAADVIRIHTSEFIDFDLGEARNVGCFIAIGPSGLPFSIPESATIQLLANNVNDFDSPALTVTMTAEDTGVFRFLDDVNDTTYRYWRWKFIDRENPGGPSVFDLRVIYLGDFDELTDRNFETGFQARLVDQSVITLSESGVAYSRLKSPYWVYSAAIDWTKTADRYLIRDLFEQVGNHTPFFISIDPGAEISESVGEMTKFVLFEGEYSQDHRLYNYYGQSLTVREVVG